MEEETIIVDPTETPDEVEEIGEDEGKIIE